MSRRYAPLLVILLLSACSQQQLRDQQSREEAVAERLAPAPAEEGPAEGQLIYMMLVGDFAEQRGDHHTATQVFMQAAKLAHEPRLARQATRTAVYTQDYALVQEAAQLWVSLDPKDVDARQSLAALLLRSGQTEAAREQLQQVIHLEGPERGFAILVVLLSQQNSAHIGAGPALKLLEELAAPYPNLRDAHYAVAQLAAEEERYDLALQRLDRVDAISPNWPRALLLRANIHNSRGELPEAIATLKRTLALVPDDHNLRLGYARLLVAAKRFPEARAEYATLVKALPENGDVIHAVALLAMQSGDLGAAERYLTKMLALPSHADLARFLLGSIAEERGRQRDAIDWYQRVEQGERYLDARFRVAMLLAKSQGVAAGRSYLQGLKMEEPDDQVRVILAEAELLSEHDAPAQAIAVYERGLRLFPDHEELLYARAMTAERIDRLDILEHDLKAILHQDPDNARALNALGFTLADRTDRLEEARRYIEQAYKLMPTDAAIVDSMGWVLYRQGQYTESLTYLRKANKMLEDGEIAAHLGELLFRMGRKAEAQQVFDAARKQFPDHPVLRRTLLRLGL